MRVVWHHWVSQVVIVVKKLPAIAEYVRDAGSIPRSGRTPGRGNCNPLQYSCLENSMDKRAWQATVHRVTQIWTHWSNLSCTHTWHCYQVVWCFCLNLWKSCQIFQSSWTVLHSYTQFMRLSIELWPCQLLATLNFWCGDFWYLIGFILHCPNEHFFSFQSVQFSSVAQSCLTLCDPMNRSTPGLPVHHQLPEFT